MLPSNHEKKRSINYEIAEINSYDKMRAKSHCERMIIGKNSHRVDYRVLIKFNLDNLPDNIQLVTATLTVVVTKGSTFQLFGYNLNAGWSIYSINWVNQPSIDFNDKIFEKTISGCDKYYIDITNQVKEWLADPNENYGMILMGSDTSATNDILIYTEQGSRDNLSLLVEYCVDKDVHNVPDFFECTEDIEVSSASEYVTSGVNISLMNKVSYFIKNNNNVSIAVIAENSPDNVNYAKEIQTIVIPPGASSLLVPINFSKYIRLSITVSPGGKTSCINVWLNLQQ
jgi:hypothetical protein